MSWIKRQSMNNGFKEILILELRQNLRSKWFWFYSLMFGGFVAVMFAMGITESQIIGFVGLSRLMVTFMQVCMVILPIYVLISTVRSVVGDRESNVMEYILSLPISLSAYFWGKFISKFIAVFVPVFIALLGATIWGTITNIDVPWDLFSLYSALLASMIFCFLGLSMFISAKAHSQDLAVSSAFIYTPDVKGTRSSSPLFNPEN
jgi:ABC-2 type transport system permease protein